MGFVSDENVVDSIEDVFECGKQIGTGATARVLKAKLRENGRCYALKEMATKNRMSRRSFFNEYRILRMLRMHPNTVQYHEVYCDPLGYYIATEYCSGGTMLKRIMKKGCFTEKKAAGFTRSILSAVKYMHQIDIVHRDLKCSNIVFSHRGKGGVLKIIDFGESIVVDPERKYNSIVGTIHYMPPEIDKVRTGNDLRAGDCWSIGVIAYYLVTGRLPFTGHDRDEVLRCIQKKDHQIKFPQSKSLSARCKDFIHGLLRHDIANRTTAADALKHEWIEKFADSVTHRGI